MTHENGILLKKETKLFYTSMPCSLDKTDSISLTEYRNSSLGFLCFIYRHKKRFYLSTEICILPLARDFRSSRHKMALQLL